MTRLKHKKHERFCRVYTTNGFNGSAAARAVGYSERSCDGTAYDILRYPQVIVRIAELMSDIDEKLEMTQEETVAELNKLAKFNPQDMYDDDGFLIPIHQLDADVAANVKEIEHEPITGKVTKVKAGGDKKGALDMQMRYHNAYENDQKAGAGIIVIPLDEKDMKA